jgi:hypothetical protein
MGRGNQIIRAFDGDNVKTYYMDFHSDVEDVRAALVANEKEELLGEMKGKSFAIRRRLLTSMMLDGRYPIEISDDRCYQEQDDEQNDGIQGVAWALNGIEGFTKLDEFVSHEELVAGFNDYGLVIATSKHCLVVIADNESNVAIGCVPAVLREEIEYDAADYRDDAEADLIQTRKRADARYEITDDDIEERAEEMKNEAEENEFEKQIEQYKVEANLAMAEVHQFFGTQSISRRGGAWTSCTVPSYDELLATIGEEEIKKYYY